MSSEVLSSSPTHRIVHHRPERSRKMRVLITFGADGLSDIGDWTEFALIRGYETIHVSSARGAGFQSLSVEDFAAAVAAVIGSRKVITLGAKVGGRAALFYGGAIQSQIIAFSPQAGDTSSSTHTRAEVAPNGGHATVLYDPMDPVSQTFVTEWVLPVCPHAQVLPVVLTGAETMQAFDNAGYLAPFLEKSLSGYIPKKVRQVFAPSTAKGLWAQGLAQWFEGDTRNALHSMLASVRAVPEARTLMDLAARAHSVSDADALRAVAAIVGKHKLWASMNGKTARVLLNAQRNAPVPANA